MEKIKLFWVYMKNGNSHELYICRIIVVQD